jgi:hypothetical protein
VKHLVTIFLSLLLVASQTSAVADATGRSAAVTKPGCCGNNCQCCVGQPDAPLPAPAQAPASVSAHNPFVLPPTAVMRFTAGPSSDGLFPLAATATFRAASMPLFQRNCVFLI